MLKLILNCYCGSVGNIHSPINSMDVGFDLRHRQNHNCSDDHLNYIGPLLSVPIPSRRIITLKVKVKVGVLRPVQQPGSYWDRSSELPLVGLEPTEVTAYD